MLAWDKARIWWEDHSTVPFEERLGWHLSCGLVYSTRESFLMASEVCWDAERKAIVESRGSRVESQQPNAWFLELAVLQGSPMALLFQIAPRQHEWVLFRRNNGFKIHAYRWDHFARRVKFSSPLCVSAPLRESMQSPTPSS